LELKPQRGASGRPCKMCEVECSVTSLPLNMSKKGLQKKRGGTVTSLPFYHIHQGPATCARWDSDIAPLSSRSQRPCKTCDSATVRSLPITTFIKALQNVRSATATSLPFYHVQKALQYVRSATATSLPFYHVHKGLATCARWDSDIAPLLSRSQRACKMCEVEQ